MISIIISGCIKQSSNKTNKTKEITYAEPNEVSFRIELEKYNVSKNSTSFLGNATIRNIMNYAVLISEYFTVGNEIQFFMLDNNRSQFSSSMIMLDIYKDVPINLLPNETINYSFDLFNYYNFYQENGERIEWPRVGKYTLFAKYNYKFISNTIQIEIE